MKLLSVVGGGLFVLALGAMTVRAGDKKDNVLLEVPVSKPILRKVTDFADYTGRASAREFVIVQPRVTGYLLKIAFKEGDAVKAGDTLFEVDPRPYQAQAAAARAKVAQAEASLKYARAVNARFKELENKQRGAVSMQELDQYQAQEEQAAAILELDKAHLQTAKLNLEWTVVRAPIAGRVGRWDLTVGNLVKQDETKLTTLVSGPMLVYFDVDERTMLRILYARKKAKAPANAAVGQPVLMGLANEDGYPHRTAVEFTDSRVNPGTASVQMRAVLAEAKDGMPQLMHGMTVRVRLPIGHPYEALLVLDRAVITDQGMKFVYVVNSEKQVELRRVTLGQLQPDGLRVVEQGLKKDDMIAIGALQRLRPGMKVQPELTVMPMVK